VKIYSALYNTFQPLKSFYPGAEFIHAGPDTPLEAPGILVIWGGSDIHPALYHKENVASHVGGSPSIRDQAEAKLFAKAVEAGLVIFGVCRGAQLGCALSGGILVQDVSGHGHDHRMTTISGETIVTSSLHHQMMYPWDIPHRLLAWSSMPQSVIYVGLTEGEMEKWPKREYDGGEHVAPIEPEVVWFPQTKCLATQGHPEFMHPTTPYNLYMKKLLDEFAPRGN
jgi:hypothetical protein